MHYRIEFAKIVDGWIVKRMSKNYNYFRVAKSPKFVSIKEAEIWIHENDKNMPWIDHCIEGNNGHLIDIDDWKQCCELGDFADCDGFGEPVNSKYEIIKMSGDDIDDQMIYPSDYIFRGGIKIPHETKFILWYNR